MILIGRESELEISGFLILLDFELPSLWADGILTMENEVT